MLRLILDEAALAPAEAKKKMTHQATVIRVIPYGSSVVVSDQRPGDRSAGLVVVPDRGGHGQDALGDPDGDSFEGAAAVGFEVELAFEGVVDRFDELADGL